MKIPPACVTIERKQWGETGMRLDKFLSAAAGVSRKDAKALIRSGQVTVNGATARAGDCQVQEDADRICCGGAQLYYRRYWYYMLNKPPGYVCATRDSREPTVLELLEGEGEKGLFPVGRLDKDTVGLLLLTNDGALAHNLLSPARHVPKTYFARVGGVLTEREAAAFAEGLEIGDKRRTLPAELNILQSGEVSEAEITLREGRFHQIKRMFLAVGMETIYLKRLRMGSLCLDEGLAEGEYRPLDEREVEELQKNFC